MLSPADVLKIKCKFVSKVKEFLTLRKYIVDPCPCMINSYYVDASMVTLLPDCIEYVDECRLQSLADGYPIVPEVVEEEPVQCTEQVNVTITATTQRCDTNVYFDNQIDATIRPRIDLYDDEVYHDAIINLVADSCNEADSVALYCGCTDEGATCDDDLRVSGSVGFTLKGYPALYPSGFIKSLRLTPTDSNGFPTTAIDVSTDPADLATWTACGTCVPVVDTDLLFGAAAADYKQAWIDLMENISKTLFSDAVILEARLDQLFSGSNAEWIYQFKIKHNPASEWLGIDKNNYSMQISTGSVGVTLGNTSKVFITAIGVPSQSVQLTTPCDTLTYDIKTTALATITPTNNTNFNKLEFVTATAPVPLTKTLTSGSTDCSLTTLTASYTTTSTVASRYWLDEADTNLGSTLSITVDSSVPQTYRFVLELENGCEVSSNYIIT